MKYENPEDKPQVVRETSVSANSIMERIDMSFDIPVSCDEESFRLLMMVHAKHLIQNGSLKKKRRILSDEQLALELESLPDFRDNSDYHEANLTKDDYKRFMRTHKPIKGIGKWL